MTAKQFYDWQLDGGTDDVMRMVSALEKADISWCVIGGVAVNNWAADPMVTQDVDFVVQTDQNEKTIAVLEAAGFSVKKRPFWVDFKGHSKVNIQLSMEAFYNDFPKRAAPGDIHGILMRVAAPEDVLAGKIKAWSEPTRGSYKRLKDQLDIARLVGSLHHLWAKLPPALQALIMDPATENEADYEQGR